MKELPSDLGERQEQYAEWQKHYRLFRQNWEQFKSTEGGTKGQEEIEREGEIEAVIAFLEKYEGVPEGYMQTFDRLLPRLEQRILTREDSASFKADLAQLEQSDLIQRVNDFSEELSALTAITVEEYEAAQVAINTSDRLRLQVIGVSMAGSVAIAIVLSILTSRAIAQPIQSLTQIAQQSINESNFDLQATVTTKDEIGTLAASFNQLIASVKRLLEEQQFYSQALETKVAERTQELSDKAIQLQDLLEKLHQSQLQMIQSEKMSSLGQLVAGVAHEINNPVSFIYGNLSYVQDYTDNLLKFVHLYQTQFPHPGAEIEKEAEEIELEFLRTDLPKILNSMKIGAERIRQIVLSLRNFSWTDAAEFKAVDIHECLDNTLLILGHRLKAKPEQPKIEVIRDYGTLPLVECYGGQLNQVFMNLLVNAIDALDEHSATRTYQELEANPSRITIHTAAASPQWISIAIADNGSGIPEAIQKQIFNPFFTTKPAGRGTGMGLAISYQIIIEKHSGRLECFSTPEGGTEFVIHVPVQQQFPDAATKNQSNKPNF
ncbi:MAG: HAMP domain-containing histidine kinase [Leptolyngbyaceae cyanobacterium SM1_3_5]|nr:HAMP domain-containing histidine kinase [Leptolyngbyaceae cyanobacterium SM1_3_5]